MVENVLQKIVWQFLKKKKSLTCNCHTALQPPSWASRLRARVLTAALSATASNWHPPRCPSTGGRLTDSTHRHHGLGPAIKRHAPLTPTPRTSAAAGGVPRRDHGRRERHGGSAPGHRHKASIAVTRALSLLVEALAVHARTVQPLRGLAVRRAQNQAELNTHAQMSKARARKRERDPWKVLTPTPWL